MPLAAWANDGTGLVLDDLTNSALTVTEGSTGTFKVKLLTEPAADVTVTPSSDNKAVATVSSVLTFTTTTWNIAQTVTVTGVEDDNDMDDTATVTLAVTSTDTNYDTVESETVAVTVTETPATVEELKVTGGNLNANDTSFDYTIEITFSKKVILRGDEVLKLELIAIIPPTVSLTAFPGTSDGKTYDAQLSLSKDGGHNNFSLKVHNTSGNLGLLKEFRVPGCDDDCKARPVDNDGLSATIPFVPKIEVSDNNLSADKKEATVTVIFPQRVTGFEREHITVSPEGTAELTDFKRVDADPGEEGFTTYTATLTLKAPDNSEGDITLSVASGVVDRIGISNTAATSDPVKYNTNPVDTTAPTVTITANDYDLREGESPATVTVTFSEPVNGFELNDIDITVEPEETSASNLLSNFKRVDGNMIYTADLIPPENESGTITLNVNAGVAQNNAGINNIAADKEVEIEYNTGYDPQEAFEQVSEAVLPGVLHNKMGHHVEALRSRVETINSPGRDDSQISMELEEMANTIATTVFDYGDALASGTFDWQQALAGRSFSFPSAATSNSTVSKSLGEMDDHTSRLFSTLAFWGSTDYSSFSREVDQNGLQADADGHSFTVHLGADVQPSPELLTGLALAFSRSQIDWDSTDDVDGTYTATFTTLHPYVSWFAGDWQVWTSALFGTGDTEWDTEEYEYEAVGESSNIFGIAGGVRFRLWSSAAEEHPLSLSLRLDGATASFLDVDAKQARLSVEAARQFPVQSGELTGAASLGLRIRDDSTYGTGTAVEVGAGTTWQGERLAVSGQGRLLFGVGEQEWREWGISGTVLYSPGRDGEGVMVSLEPSIGVTTSKQAELWRLTGSELALGEQGEAEPRLRAELAYGLRRGTALLTPYTELSITPSSNIYGIGLRYDLTSAVSVDVHGSHTAKVRGENENSVTVDFNTQL